MNEYRYIDTVEILDLDNNKSMANVANLRNARMDAGIYYDEEFDALIAVAGEFDGGSVAMNSVEYYEFEKNQWYEIPKTIHNSYDSTT